MVAKMLAPCTLSNRSTQPSHLREINTHGVYAPIHNLLAVALTLSRLIGMGVRV